MQIQSQTDIADPARIKALNSVLGLTEDRPRPFAHQVLFWDAKLAAELGQDGHPRTGHLIPDLGLPRRMWAGGSLEFLEPLKAGTVATKTTKIGDVEHKIGRSGKLGFVTLIHEVSQENLCAREHQNLVYREPYNPKAKPARTSTAPSDATIKTTRQFSTTDLFRYSALTHNGHRIHYDRDYARDVEGYAGLVVHAPLLAQVLMLMAEDHLGGLRHFEFRATAPLFDFEAASFEAVASDDGLSMWVAGPDRRLCMRASASA